MACLFRDQTDLSSQTPPQSSPRGEMVRSSPAERGVGVQIYIADGRVHFTHTDTHTDREIHTHTHARTHTHHHHLNNHHHHHHLHHWSMAVFYCPAVKLTASPLAVFFWWSTSNRRTTSEMIISHPDVPTARPLCILCKRCIAPF